MSIASWSRSRSVPGVAGLAIAMLISVTACAYRAPVATRTDAEITSDVQARLAADAQTQPFAITVDTKDGVVRVSGGVAKDTDRNRVERIALDAPGVRSVDNDVLYGAVPEPAKPSSQDP